MKFSGEQEMQVIMDAYKSCRTAVLTGPAALRLMEVATLEWVREVDLLLPGHTRAKARNLQRPGCNYRSGFLPGDLWVEYKGVRVVKLIVALFDTYRYHGRLPALVSIESALQKRAITKDYLQEQIQELPRAKGMKNFRGLVGYASSLSESTLETLNRDAILQANLPGIRTIEQQVPFHYEGEHGELIRGRADMEINGCIVVEVDGRAKARDDWEGVTRSERERERWLMRGDKVLIRARWEDVVSGEVVRRVAKALQLLGQT